MKMKDAGHCWERGPRYRPLPQGLRGSHRDVTATHTLCPAVTAVQLRNPARVQQDKLQLGRVQLLSAWLQGPALTAPL